jgi:hypothetical protein
MRKLSIIVVCLAVGLVIGCSKGTQEVEASNPCESKYLAPIFNECSPHTVDTDTIHHDHMDDPLGVGADVLIHETKHVDLVGEYRYDFENELHSAFAVFRTKTSLVNIIKSLLSRD